ncbi:MAG: HAD-IC family P-type ATPase, partial [Nanoarchaeota archaeon]|nr:HAD-IC family P-type ATPase [Nanoarchaeota archaeon]
QKNMVFSGTVITSGYARAVVVRTGMQTEIGKIAYLIQKSETKITPLQKKLASLGTKLSILTAIICVIVFFFTFLKSQIGLMAALMTAISLAVAAIPEGLPAVVTISLALGVKRMVKKNVLVRKLASVETLGCTTVICTDKTGTLTHNEMTVKKIFVDNQIIEVGGEGYNTNGGFNKKTKDLELLLKCGLLCNDANVEEEKAIGDPTEASLIISARKIGMKSLTSTIPRIKSIPFDSKRKMMSTLNRDEKTTLYSKGAPDVILSKCSKIIINGKIRNITEKDKKEILEHNDKFAEHALRVLAFAYKEFNHNNKSVSNSNSLLT